MQPLAVPLAPLQLVEGVSLERPSIDGIVGGHGDVAAEQGHAWSYAQCSAPLQAVQRSLAIFTVVEGQTEYFSSDCHVAVGSRRQFAIIPRVNYWSTGRQYTTEAEPDVNLPDEGDLLTISSGLVIVISRQLV